MAITSPGDDHEAFTQWAISKGVQIKGIAPAHFPGRRLGMIATRTIKVRDTIVDSFQKRLDPLIETILINDCRRMK